MRSGQAFGRLVVPGVILAETLCTCWVLIFGCNLVVQPSDHGNLEG